MSSKNFSLKKFNAKLGLYIGDTNDNKSTEWVKEDLETLKYVFVDVAKNITMAADAVRKDIKFSNAKEVSFKKRHGALWRFHKVHGRKLKKNWTDISKIVLYL